LVADPYLKPIPLALPREAWPARPAGKELRACADLLLEPGCEKGTFTVLAVAAEDPGNAGPFQSVIYRAAEGVLLPPPVGLVQRLIYDATEPLWGALAPVPAGRGVVVATFPGLKIEALAAGATVMQDTSGEVFAPVPCRFTIGTDDEGYGGVWRPVLPLAPPAGAATQPSGNP
jgi:hypothetical protein